MPIIPTLKDFLAMTRANAQIEWQSFNSLLRSTPQSLILPTHYELLNEYAPEQDFEFSKLKTEEYRHNYSQTAERYARALENKGEPFEFYEPIDSFSIPENRLPAPGIIQLPLRYHTGTIIQATDDLPETGFRPHYLIEYLITSKYPEYREYIRHYCRPLGTADSTFADFNREQIPSTPLDPKRKDTIMELVIYFLNAHPFLPLHFNDTRYCKTPCCRKIIPCLQ